MRLLKKKKVCADVIGDTETSDMLKAKIIAKSNEINNWCKANNLKRDYSRELISEQIVKNTYTKVNNKQYIQDDTNKIQTPVINDNPAIHYVGKINKDMFEKISKDITTDEVIITDERIEHCNKHELSYDKYGEYLNEIVANPNYIIRGNKENTAVLMKEIVDNNIKTKTILRLKTSLDNSNYKNSIITFIKIDNKEWKRLQKNKEVLYNYKEK